MEKKLLWILCAFLAVSSASSFLPEDIEDLIELNKIEPRIFENKILDVLNSFKHFLKNGNPEEGIPPLDPYFLSEESFDFVLKDTALKGQFQNTTFAKFSDFEPVHVALRVIPMLFKLEVFLDQLHIDGWYALQGNFFNEIPVDGVGKFISETRNLTLMLNVKLAKVNSSLQIKDLLFEFKVLSQKINYTNELVDDTVHELDEKLALYILNQVQAKYVPPLLNMVKVVVNYFLRGYTISDIVRIVLSLLKVLGS